MADLPMARSAPEAGPSLAQRRQGSRPWCRVERSVVGLLAVVSVALFVRIVSLTDGDFLNSYPYISSDGFDWIYEGHWFAARLSGIDLPPLQRLRNPGFVAITAIDALLAANGRVIALVLATALLVTHVALVGMAHVLAVPRMITVAFVVSSLLSSTGFYRPWVLSDPLAVSLMLMSVWALVSYRFQAASTGALVAAVCAATAGGLTQSYALIPFLIGVVIFGCEALLRGSRLPVGLLAALLLVLAVTIGGTVLWRAAIPHEDTPDQFSLLQLSLDMAGFYSRVWSFTLLPFLPLLIACCSRRTLIDPAVVFLGAVVATFMGLTLVYQWADARFTAVYVPLLMLGAMAAASTQIRAAADAVSAAPIRRLAMATALFLAVQGAMAAPASDWEPAWSQVVLRPRDTWLGELSVVVTPIDRFGLKAACGSPDAFCERAAVPQGYDPYATRMMTAFLAYKRQTETATR